jgi:hypothetical protein
MEQNLLTQKGMDELADALHIALGVVVAWGTHFLFGWQLLHVFPMFLVPVCLKEFVYDIHFETPATSGGYVGGVLDALGYVAGFGAGWLAVVLKGLR